MAKEGWAAREAATVLEEGSVTPGAETPQNEECRDPRRVLKGTEATEVVRWETDSVAAAVAMAVLEEIEVDLEVASAPA